MDNDLVKVTFVPQGQTDGAGRRRSSYDEATWWQHGEVGTGRTTSHSINHSTKTAGTGGVVDVVAELFNTVRQRHKLSRQRRRQKDSPGSSTAGRRRRRPRTVAVYLTDGRSLDTAGTVYRLARLTRRLPRRVDVFAVGVGREVSGAQLTSVTGGRLERVLTVYTGASSTTALPQSFHSLRRLSTRLSRLICRRPRHD